MAYLMLGMECPTLSITIQNLPMEYLSLFITQNLVMEYLSLFIICHFTQIQDMEFLDLCMPYLM